MPVFRTDIQALRAIAVLLVLAFHVWPSRLTGGYVGVDVFFVISTNSPEYWKMIFTTWRGLRQVSCPYEKHTADLRFHLRFRPARPSPAHAAAPRL